MIINPVENERHLRSTSGEPTANEFSHERLPNERSDLRPRSCPGTRCNSPFEGKNNVLSKLRRRRSTGSPFEPIREENILGSAGDRDQKTFTGLNEESINLGSFSETAISRSVPAIPCTDCGSVPGMPCPDCGSVSEMPCPDCIVSFCQHVSCILFFILIVLFVSNLYDKYSVNSTANEAYGHLQEEIHTFKRSVEDLNSGVDSDESIYKHMQMDIQLLADLLPKLSMTMEYLKATLEAEAKSSRGSKEIEELLHVNLEKYKQPLVGVSRRANKHF